VYEAKPVPENDEVLVFCACRDQQSRLIEKAGSFAKDCVHKASSSVNDPTPSVEPLSLYLLVSIAWSSQFETLPLDEWKARKAYTLLTKGGVLSSPDHRGSPASRCSEEASALSRL
jgi:hypothetical protein